MKWVTGMLALLAIVSGCVSLNKGSDEVALLAPGTEEAKKPSLFSPEASLPPETVALGIGDRPGDGSRREADLWLRPSGIFTRRRLLNDSPE